MTSNQKPEQVREMQRQAEIYWEKVKLHGTHQGSSLLLY